jgi:hypothetical protein
MVLVAVNYVREQNDLIKVGDVVLVHSDTEKRSNWPLVIITELKTGNDGLVRSASIKTKHGLSNRPITKLYPLEVCTTLDSEQQPLDPRAQPAETDPVPDPPTRPSRAAARRGCDRVLEWSKQLLK